MRRTDAHTKFAKLLRQCKNAGRAPHYLAFFDCFNRQLYFEAHEVLEALWLQTPGLNHAFYKGLIQLAGAFVHVSKGRKGPALALLGLARENLQRYPAVHEGLEVVAVLEMISAWDNQIRGCRAGSEPDLLRSAPVLAVPISPGPIPDG